MRSARAYLQIQTDDLVRKVTGAGRLAGVLGGDWDLNTTLIVNSAKYQSMVQRFVDGMPWEETDLFTDVFPRRFAGGLAFRGSFALKTVADFYYSKMDALFLKLKREGFRPKHPPAVLIGRDGQFMLGNQGNHRVAMAKILGIPKIYATVVCTHALHARANDA